MAFECPQCGKQYDITLFQYGKTIRCDCGAEVDARKPQVRSVRLPRQYPGQLVITVESIRGKCPVYSVGNRIVLDEGYRINVKESDAICMHSLASVMPYYVALYNGVDPQELGLAGPEDGVARVQCLDPCEITGGGTVVFTIERRS